MMLRRPGTCGACSSFPRSAKPMHIVVRDGRAVPRRKRPCRSRSSISEHISLTLSTPSGVSIMHPANAQLARNNVSVIRLRTVCIDACISKRLPIAKSAREHAHISCVTGAPCLTSKSCNRLMSPADSVFGRRTASAPLLAAAHTSSSNH